MRLRTSLVVALVAMLALPATTLAANPNKAPPDPGTTYSREEVPLGEGAFGVYESIALDGTLLTDEIRSTADWQALAATGVENPSAMTAEGVTIQATSYKTIGRRYSAYNIFGLVIQYTIWQEFGYNGSSITYYPKPTYDHVANSGWTFKSHSETAWWVTSPTHRASRGNYYFKYEVWTPFGNIGWNEMSGWVRVDYYGSGSWTGSNS
jgi:hypothetical protein